MKGQKKKSLGSFCQVKAEISTRKSHFQRKFKADLKKDTLKIRMLFPSCLDISKLP